MYNSHMLEDVICFYEGDVEGNDPFYSDEKAYVTWNSLLFPEIDTEVARCEEGRRLNPFFLDDPSRIIDLTVSLYRGMKKTEEDIHVYRVERLVDYQVFKREGKFCSFISTSTSGFLKAYQDKKDLVLMEILIPKGTKVLDFSDVLTKYKKKEEKEILLPPYLSFQAKQLEMNKDILSIHDRNDKAPSVYCSIEVKEPIYFEKVIHIDIDECIQASRRVYECLNQKCTLEEKDVKKYILYKGYIQNEVMKRMRDTDHEDK